MIALLELVFVSLLALFASAKVVEVNEHLLEVQVEENASSMVPVPPSLNASSCSRALESFLSQSDEESTIFPQVTFALHHNGNPQACGIVPPSINALRVAANMEGCDDELDEYHLEAFLTRFFASQLNSTECSSLDDEDATPGLLGFCDMGPERTVIQLDHDDLVQVPSSTGATSLPCRYFTREGLHISSLEQLGDIAIDAKNKEKENGPVHLDLYAVPAGRVFMFAPSYVGEVFEIEHVKDTNGQSLVLKTLSLSPRVFDIYNFFSHEESDKIMQQVLADTSPTHGFKRSRTGISKSLTIQKRTSENAWASKGKVALGVKERCFRLLGFDEYIPELSDGLQVLRYNVSKAYTPHMDWLRDWDDVEEHDFDSSGIGSNRFATILLYFTNLEDGAGGETCFTEAWPTDVAEEDRVPLDEAIRQLRESGDASMLEPDSWEEELAAKCRTRLAVKPNATRAVLFYSQYPNGEPDPNSRHGACPVLKGTKVAANLWTWNGVKPGFDGEPLKRRFTEDEIDEREPKVEKQFSVAFKNSGTDDTFDENTLVYWNEDAFFGKLGPNDPPVRVKSSKGHEWNIKVNGKILKTFVVGEDEYQEFIV